MLRLGAAVYPPPRNLPEYTGQRDVLPLGRVSGEQGQRIVGLRLADTFFTYTAGRSRWGKTELAITQFLSLVRSGHGGMFLDPHEDAIQRIKSCLTEPELRRADPRARPCRRPLAGGAARLEPARRQGSLRRCAGAARRGDRRLVRLSARSGASETTGRSPSPRKRRPR